MNLREVNALDEDAFTNVFGGVFEHSPWIARGAHALRPFADVDALHAAMLAVLNAADRSEKLALIRAHPELAGRAMVAKTLTRESSGEQSGAGLDRCSPSEFATLVALNERYNAKFGFPFILAVKGYDRPGVIAEFARRVERDVDSEFDEALRQIARIADVRLRALVVA